MKVEKAFVKMVLNPVIFYSKALLQVHFTSSYNAPIKSETSTSPLLPVRAFELLRIGLVQISSPWGQSNVQMPHPIVGFVCQMPLLKNNHPRPL